MFNFYVKDPGAEQSTGDPCFVEWGTLLIPHS